MALTARTRGSMAGFEERARLVEREQHRLKRAIEALEKLRQTIDREQLEPLDRTIAMLKEAYEADATAAALPPSSGTSGG